MIAEFLRRAGFLRAVLMLGTVVLVILAPFAGGHLETSGWALVTTLIAPVGFVLFAFGLGLDMLMTWVFMSGTTGDERRRLIVVLRAEAVLLVVLLLAWTPFIIALSRVRAG